MNLSNVARRVLVAVCLLIIPIHAFAQTKFFHRWTLTENPLAIEEGGRTNTVAVHPDGSEMLAASDSGGLFKSIDGGHHWKHVDKLPVIFTQSVVYVDSNVVLVSAKADYKVTNGGGIWRSTDRGETWSQRTLNVPDFTGRLSAYEISVLHPSRIALGTSEGVFVSSNGGESWENFSNVFDSGDRTVLSVLMEIGNPNRLYAAGPSGLRVGTFPFSSWQSPLNSPGVTGAQDIHALGRSPISSHAFFVNAQTGLFRTENNGSTWLPIVSAPAGGGSCDGTSFIRTINRNLDGRVFLEMFFGNRCGLHRLRAPVGSFVDFSGQWQTATIDHGDTRDLAFFHDPVLLATTGGVHSTIPNHITTGLTWTLIGGGRAGYNALQINELKAQLVHDALNSNTIADLYVGTQDNHLWAVNALGAVHDKQTFPRGHGIHIEAQRRVEVEDDAKIVFQKCGPGCFRFKSDQRLVDHPPDTWDDAPNDRNSGPVLLTGPSFVQNVNLSSMISAGLALTDDTGANWRSFAAFAEEPKGRPMLGRPGIAHTRVDAIVYQPFRHPDIVEPYASGLMRINKPVFSAGNGTVVFPAMDEVNGPGFGGLGFVSTQGTNYQILGIDPSRALHLIAPDVVSQRMMVTDNGGELWRELPQLTHDVTVGIDRLFRTEIRGRGFIAPIVTAISFCPQDPNLVVLGTNEGGIFFSNDNGATWGRISDSERATYITAFAWQSANLVHVATYGRGLWRLENKRYAVLGGFNDLCTGCDVVSDDGTPGPPRFDASLLAFDGRIVDVRMEKGLLREVFVTPGTSVAFTGDPDDPQDDIAITESDGRNAPLSPKDRIKTGVVFTSDDQLVGTVYADSELTLAQPESEEDAKGSTDSPAKGKPYIRLATSELAPDDVSNLSATDFVAGVSYEVLIDGAARKGTVTADGNGSFETTIVAPAEKGNHLIEVRMAGDEQVIDRTLFLVR